jgi:SOS-response transcriptional repressor LexA
MSPSGAGCHAWPLWQRHRQGRGTGPERDEIVAAMIDGETTVKTLQRAEGQVWLIPHNPAYKPIPGQDATILGKVVTVLRRV